MDIGVDYLIVGLVCCLIVIVALWVVGLFTSEPFGTNTSELNLFYRPIPNIFLADNYYNYKLNKPHTTTPTATLGEIATNAFIYSRPIERQIICRSHQNRANCWEDNVNGCAWVYGFDGPGYCEVGQNVWP